MDQRLRYLDSRHSASTPTPPAPPDPSPQPAPPPTNFEVKPRRAQAPAHVADPVEYWGLADLRRKHARDLADDVLRNAPSLEPQDAAILRAVFLDHKPLTELAALTRIPVRALRRVVRDLVRRVRTPEFLFVVRNAHAWPDDRRKVARAVFVLGHSYRRVTEDHNLSLHNVRSHAKSIAVMCETSEHLVSQLTSRAAAKRLGAANLHADLLEDHGDDFDA